MTSLHLTAKSGHTAHAGFDAEERAAEFLKDLRGGTADAGPLNGGDGFPLGLGDDFRPFLGKKLRYVRRVADTTFYEEAP